MILSIHKKLSMLKKFECAQTSSILSENRQDVETAPNDSCIVEGNNFFLLMPSPSTFSKFVLSVLKVLGILKFLGYTENILDALK